MSAAQRPGCGYLTDDPEVMVARVALGLTVYLDDAAHWAERGLPAMVAALLRMVPEGSLEWLNLGLDVQDPDMAAWFVARQLPATNWLTLLGNPLLEARGLAPDALRAHPWEREVTVLPLARGVIVRAGERPVTGDVNDLVYPETYDEVPRALEALLPKRFARYYGGFHDGEQTLRWVRRFVEPEGWQ